MRIVELCPGDARVKFLIDSHRRYCEEHTPEGSGHAVDASASEISDIRYFVAMAEGTPLGCIGLRALDGTDAEIKTMHVLASARGRGIGELLVNRLLDIARGEGIGRLFLETGKSDGFAASRRLYSRLGFEACDSFGAYASDPFSYRIKRIV
jgi:putative acetyltransferase